MPPALFTRLQELMMRWLRYPVVVLMMFWGMLAQAQTLRVGIPLPGQEPYFWRDDAGEYRGIYVDVLSLLAEDMDLQLSFVPLSQARLLKHFEIGEIDVEAGVSPQSDDSPALARVSLFTRPFGLVNEVIIYRQELSFPVFILKDLKGRRVATVRGASAPAWLERENFASEWQIAQRVHRGWNDIGLMKEAVALHYQRSGKLNFQISLPYASNPVSFRLHRRLASLLPGFNQRIAALEKSGQLDDIVCRYLCGAQ